MSYLKRIELDEEARRYLKHFEVFEGTRTRALSYLDQVWHALALTLRKLSAQPHYNELKVELLGGSSTQGVKWMGMVQGERVYLELSDVRRWPSMSGVWVGCALGAESRSGRSLIRSRVSDRDAHALLPEALQEMSAPLTFGLESDRQLCLPLPLSARPPAEEAQSLLGYGLSLWGLLLGDAPHQRSGLSSVERPPTPSVRPHELHEPSDPPQRSPQEEPHLTPSEAPQDRAREEEPLSDPYGYGLYEEEALEAAEEPPQGSPKPSLRERAQRMVIELAESPPPEVSSEGAEERLTRLERRAEPQSPEAPSPEALSTEAPSPEALVPQAPKAPEEPLASAPHEPPRSRLGQVTPLSQPLNLDDDDLYPVSSSRATSQERHTRPPLRPRPSSRRGGRSRAGAPPRMPEGTFEQLSADELEERLRHLSKDEMISLIAEQRRAQQSPRANHSPPPPRVIGGGGRRDLSAVTGEAERFIPKRLEEPPPPPRPSAQPQEAPAPISSEQPAYERPVMLPPPQVLPGQAPPPLEQPVTPDQVTPDQVTPDQVTPDQVTPDQVTPPSPSYASPNAAEPPPSLSTPSPPGLSAPMSAGEVTTQPSPPPPEELEPSVAPPSAPQVEAPAPIVQGAQVQLFSQEDVAPPSYIKSMQQESHELEIFTQALTRCGLPPWRINSYADGQGKIIWLSNGAHIDIAPDGEVTLGGESQEDTRARLARVGVTLL